MHLSKEPPRSLFHWAELVCFAGYNEVASARSARWAIVARGAQSLKNYHTAAELLTDLSDKSETARPGILQQPLSINHRKLDCCSCVSVTDLMWKSTSVLTLDTTKHFCKNMWESGMATEKLFILKIWWVFGAKSLILGWRFLNNFYLFYIVCKRKT